MPVEDYEAVPYVGQPLPPSAPAARAMTSLAHGGPMPRLDGARVLELGCGDGANLIPLAFCHPDYELVGIDVSPGAIAKAREGASAVGVTNVRFEEADLAHFEGS